MIAAITAWMRGTRLDMDRSAALFFGRPADDPVVRNLQSAAVRGVTASSHVELRGAAEKLAAAMRAIGLYQWPRFSADAEARAREPATVVAIKASELPHDPMKDAIRAVYPVETVLGISAAGAASGAAAAARATAGALARQITRTQASKPLPGRASNFPSTVAAENRSAASVSKKLDQYLLNPDHVRGGPKARWFEKALGFTQVNSKDLAKQLTFDETTAVQTEVTEHGTLFRQMIDIKGSNGRTIPVQTVWMRGKDGVVQPYNSVSGKKVMFQEYDVVSLRKRSEKVDLLQAHWAPSFSLGTIRLT